MTMTPKKVATELANKFVTKSVFDMTDDELKQERITAKRNALNHGAISLVPYQDKSNPKNNCILNSAPAQSKYLNCFSYLYCV